MSAQPPITKVKARADQLCPDLTIPKDITNVRPYLEGVIAYMATGGRRDRRTKNPYKYGGTHYQDWERGWSYAEQKKQEPKFLKKCEAA